MQPYNIRVRQFEGNKFLSQGPAVECAMDNENIESLQYQLVPNRTAAYSLVGVSALFVSLLSVSGSGTNVINAVVYYKQGIKDSVTVSYFALSLWDLGVCTMSFLILVCFIIEHYFPVAAINFEDVSYVYASYTRSFFRGVSTCVTCFLSVEICICVLIPFNVRILFTKTRAIIINLGFVCVLMVCYSPLMGTQSLHYDHDPRFNQTRLILWWAKDRDKIGVYVSVFDAMAVPIIGQVVSTLTTVILLTCLKRSTKFKQEALSCPKRDDHKIKLHPVQKTKSTMNESIKKRKTLKSRYTKLAKVFLWLNIKYFICNLPSVLVNLATAVELELEFKKKYEQLYDLLYMISFLVTLASININIVIYYCANRTYRGIFLSLFVVRSGH